VWCRGDFVRLSVRLPGGRMVNHPYVTNNNGRVALTRGPLVYCVEGADHPGMDVRDLVLPEDAELQPGFRADMLGGVVTLTGRASRRPPGGWESHLYRAIASPGSQGAEGPGEPVSLLAIPYYAWANREPGPMQVWIRSR
jgi:uncharacterized protein